MNSIVLRTLERVQNCDAKNLTPLIESYTGYTPLEEMFRDLLLKYNVNTREEDYYGHVDENIILHIIANPEKYPTIRRLNNVLYSLMYLHINSSRKFYEPLLHVLTTPLISSLRSDPTEREVIHTLKWLAFYSYDDLQTIFQKCNLVLNEDDFDSVYEQCQSSMMKFICRI